MRKLSRVLALVLLSACGGSAEEAGAVPAKGMDPPFNLKWGEPPGGLVDWAGRHKLDVHVKAPGDRPRINILIISPRAGTLPDHESTSLEAHFIDRRLFEVSVHYTYPGRGIDHVRARRDALKDLLVRQYGPLRPEGRRNRAQDGITTLSEAHHAEPVPGHTLLLAYTELRDVKRGDAVARFSLMFHSDKVLNGN